MWDRFLDKREREREIQTERDTERKKERVREREKIWNRPEVNRKPKKSVSKAEKLDCERDNSKM